MTKISILIILFGVLLGMWLYAYRMERIEKKKINATAERFDALLNDLDQCFIENEKLRSEIAEISQ